MNKKYLADIKYSKQLRNLFTNAEWWWKATVWHYGRKKDGTHIEHDPFKLIRSTDSIFKTLKDCINPETLALVYPAIHTDMITQILPRRIDNEHRDLSIVFDSINDTVWIGYDGKTLADEIAASDKKLVNAACKLLLLWIKQKEIK